MITKDIVNAGAQGLGYISGEEIEAFVISKNQEGLFIDRPSTNTALPKPRYFAASIVEKVLEEGPFLDPIDNGTIRHLHESYTDIGRRVFVQRSEIAVKHGKAPNNNDVDINLETVRDILEREDTFSVLAQADERTIQVLNAIISDRQVKRRR